MVFGVTFLVASGSEVLASTDGTVSVLVGFGVLALVLVVGGFVLTAGYRADRGQPEHVAPAGTYLISDDAAVARPLGVYR